jgi:uncharacterized protein (UPF0335 family)
MALQTQEDTQHELDTLRQYLKRRHVIESEIQTLKEDIKTLDDEFKDKLDIKTLRLAAAVAKAKAKVSHKYTFENFLDVIESEGWFEKG